MRGALWLFLYLVLHADRGTGRLTRRYQTIARDTGIPARTIRRWLLTLRRQNYVTVTSSGRALVIHIRRWKSLPARK